MQVHGPSETLSPDGSDISVHLNPGSGATAPFAVMTIGHVDLHIRTAEECDWLIKAAAEAKRLLTPDTPQWCPASTEVDGATECGVTVYCDRAPGHPGSHRAPGPDEGSEVAWGDEWRQRLTDEIRHIAIGGE
jgi:hypothetical protein